MSSRSAIESLGSCTTPLASARGAVFAKPSCSFYDTNLLLLGICCVQLGDTDDIECVFETTRRGWAPWTPGWLPAYALSPWALGTLEAEVPSLRCSRSRLEEVHRPHERELCVELGKHEYVSPCASHNVIRSVTGVRQTFAFHCRLQYTKRDNAVIGCLVRLDAFDLVALFGVQTSIMKALRAATNANKEFHAERAEHVVDHDVPRQPNAEAAHDNAAFFKSERPPSPVEQVRMWLNAHAARKSVSLVEFAKREAEVTEARKTELTQTLKETPSDQDDEEEEEDDERTGDDESEEEKAPPKPLHVTSSGKSPRVHDVPAKKRSRPEKAEVISDASDSSTVSTDNEQKAKRKRKEIGFKDLIIDDESDTDKVLLTKDAATIVPETQAIFKTAGGKKFVTLRQYAASVMPPVLESKRQLYMERVGAGQKVGASKFVAFRLEYCAIMDRFFFDSVVKKGATKPTKLHYHALPDTLQRPATWSVTAEPMPAKTSMPTQPPTTVPPKPISPKTSIPATPKPSTFSSSSSSSLSALPSPTVTYSRPAPWVSQRTYVPPKESPVAEKKAAAIEEPKARASLDIASQAQVDFVDFDDSKVGGFYDGKTLLSERALMRKFHAALYDGWCNAQRNFAQGSITREVMVGIDDDVRDAARKLFTSLITSRAKAFETLGMVDPDPRLVWVTRLDRPLFDSRGFRGPVSESTIQKSSPIRLASP